jgi:hypothetical protein
MADILTDTVGILAACLLIALLATGLVLLRPAARRRRRRRRHQARPKIDLFVPAGGDPKADA